MASLRGSKISSLEDTLSACWVKLFAVGEPEAELNVASSNVFVPCEICGDCFPTPEDLHNHLRSKHANGPLGKHQCSYCPYSTDVRSHLVVHERTHTGHRPYVCHVCQKGFSCQSHLKDHLRIHTKQRPFRSHAVGPKGSQGGHRPFVCHLCPSSFLRRNHLQDHLRIHTNERPFGCEHCGQRFTQASNLARHRKIHADAF